MWSCRPRCSVLWPNRRKLSGRSAPKSSMPRGNGSPRPSSLRPPQWSARHPPPRHPASPQLAQAAAVIGSQPSALQLRYLQTLTEIAVEKNSTIVLPLPLDLLAPIIQILQRHAGEPVHEPLNGSRTNEPSLTR